MVKLVVWLPGSIEEESEPRLIDSGLGGSIERNGETGESRLIIPFGSADTAASQLRSLADRIEDKPLPEAAERPPRLGDFDELG